MSALVIETQPSVEPVALAEAKNYLRVDITDDDTLITNLIVAAREAVEAFTARSFVQKGYRQSLDAFPYYTDSVVSQMSYPPAYYSLPRYATTLWNYSQMILLYAPPLASVTAFKYIDTNGNLQTLDPSLYIVDSDNEPARLFPKAGGFWPSVQYVPNAVQIHYTAGYSSDASKVPQAVRAAMMMLVGNWYENRTAAAQGNFGELPNHVKSLLWTHRILTFDQTRG